MENKWRALIFALALALVSCNHTTTIKPPLDLSAYFDAIYLAQSGFEDFAKTKSITDGVPARVIKDLKGNKDLIYGGPESPSPIWTTPPVFHQDETGGYIMLPNVLNTVWRSKQFAAIPQPFDVYVVLRDLEAVTYEGYFAVWFGLRNRGDHLAIGTNLEGNFDAPVVLDYNKRTIVRIRFDGIHSRLWLNNVAVPPGEVGAGNAGIEELGYGTNSHVAQHDFFGMWVKFGTLTEAEHSQIYTKLEQQYHAGQYPDQPLASHIRADWNGTGWTANYDYVSKTGLPEDKTRTEYQWFYRDPALDLSLATFLPGANAKKKILLRSDYPTELPGPHDETGRFVFAGVKVYDTAGNSWRLLRSPFTHDNIK
jgi:hypothetical protein